ncbi:MAG: hypothetical protein BJ554DRAFT_5471 [Olpidium bornovanus]|uniref:Uncharacterized protein n=1 Tax=Olpidium bornovanus TaxID=278681 RepID=A0A8H7ZZT1_9FUNG|nr:MAG: hypothetical protein BJ554DRAFT_5471 [Olpidium bornovanus]
MSAVSRRLAKELASFLQQKEKEVRLAALQSAAARGDAASTAEPVGEDTSYGDIHELGPVEEADLLLWRARISGPRGSPYEGEVETPARRSWHRDARSKPAATFPGYVGRAPSRLSSRPRSFSLTRRLVAANQATEHAIRDALLPSEYSLQDRGNMPRHPRACLVAGMDASVRLRRDRHSAVPPGTEQPT